MKELTIKNFSNKAMDIIIEMAGFGIGYWADYGCVGDDYYEVCEEESGKLYRLSKEDILRGINLYIENGNEAKIIYHGKVAPENIDSDVADEIIQYACFGELVYG